MEIQNYKQLKTGLDLLVTTDTRAARINSIPINKSQGQRLHWRSIVLLAEELVLRGEPVIIEARFKTGGRADIFLPRSLLIIEVMDSETPEMLEKKIKEHYESMIVNVAGITTKELLFFGAATSVDILFKRAKKVRL